MRSSGAASGSVSKRRADVGPPAVRGDLRGHVVEDVDEWRQSRLDRMLGQHPARERVQRADGGGVEVVEAGPRPRRTIPAGLARVFQGHPHPVAQLGGGLLGERDGGDVRSGTPSSTTSPTNRLTSTDVLPDPAPAPTNSVSASDEVARARSAASGSSTALTRTSR